MYQSKNTVESTSENTREREEVDWENSQWLASFPALDPLEEDVEGHIEDLWYDSEAFPSTHGEYRYSVEECEIFILTAVSVGIFFILFILVFFLSPFLA